MVFVSPSDCGKATTFRQRVAMRYIIAQIHQSADATTMYVTHDTSEIDVDTTFSIPYENVYLFDGETEKVIDCN